MIPPPYSSSADWLRPAEEQEGLQRYAETLRERWRLILLAVFVTTAIAVAYVATAQKTYEATADMLITPVNSSDPALTSLGLLRESADPTRDVQTASQLIENIDVARLAAEKLDNGESAKELLDAVAAEPVASSNIVALTATEDSPAEAQKVANVFAEAAVEERTNVLHEEIAARLPQLEAIVAAGATEATEASEASVPAQIAELQALAAGPDPTVRLQTKATLPTGPASPRKKLSLIAGLIAGLIIGIGGAFALQALDPRLRRESQLARLYRLPVLARIPRAPHAPGRWPLIPGSASPAIDEAYRTLRATLSSGPRGKPDDPARVILVTSSSSAEGKTTSAVNLATSFAQLGKRVILIEADLRRPVFSKVFGVERRTGVVSVLTDQSSLRESLAHDEPYGANLDLLLAEPEYGGGWITDLFTTPRAEAMIAEARAIADFVVIDSPPLNEVADALPLAVAADDILFVVRMGQSRFDKMRELGELLAENNAAPSGFVLVGTKMPPQSEYHYSASLAKGGERNQSRRPSERANTPS